MNDSEELLDFLRRPALARLWAVAREKVEALGRVGGTVRLSTANHEERKAVAGLLGLSKLPPEDLSVSLHRLDQALSESRLALGLEALLELLGGPLRDLPAERRRHRNRRRSLFEFAQRHPVLSREPALASWLEGLEASGLLLRLSSSLEDAESLLGEALAVLGELLPREAAPPASRLAVLANQALGRSHGLDPGRPAATLVLGALAHLRGTAPPRTGAERREVWEWAGVVADDLSCDVLALGLRPAGGGAVGRALRALAAAGEPARITLRQLGSLAGDRLAGDRPDASGAVWPGGTVRVCENPMVVALAADELGAACPPLICLAGVPNQAGRTLLGQHLAAGATLAYHGDFDWPGLRIANNLLRDLPWTPWRFTAEDYRQALARGTDGSPEGAPLTGDPVGAEWDPELAPAMREAGVVVEEEAVVGELLGDLAAGDRGSKGG